MTFNLSLSILDSLGNPRMFDSLAFLHTEFLHQSTDTLAGKDTHEVIFKRQIEASGTWVTLPSGTTTQLVVDAP